MQDSNSDLFHLSNDLLSYSNLEGYFTKVNKRWTEVTGYSPEELTSKPFLEFVHPDDRQRTINETRELSLGKTETVLFDNRYRKKNGGYVWLEWNAVVDHAKNITYAVARDITHVKERDELNHQIQTALLEITKLSTLEKMNLDEFTNVFLEKLCHLFKVENASHWIFHDANTTLECIASVQKNSKKSRIGLRINKKDYPIYFEGMEKEVIISAENIQTHRYTKEFTKYGQEYQVSAMLDAQVYTKDHLRGIICLESKDERIWTLDEQNGLLSLLSIFSIALLNDERLQLTNHLHELSSIVNTIQEAVVITNSKREVEWVNHAFNEMTGFSLNEVAGKNLGYLLQGGNTDPKDIEAIKNGLNSEKPFAHEILNYAKNGESYWIELSITPIFDERGALSKFYGIQKNITKRKEREREVRTINNYLKSVHELSLESNLTQNEYFDRYLTIGCQLYDLSLGIVSKINDNVYEIIATKSSIELKPNPGDTMNLDDTYCSMIIANNETFATHYAGKNKAMCKHPAYLQLELESYIGAPIWVNGRIFGTVNFSSPQSRKKPFTIHEIEMIELMASDISKRIEADLSRSELLESEERYRKMTEGAPVGIAVHSGGKVKYVNPYGRKLLEANESLIDYNIADFLPQETVIDAHDRIAKLLRNEIDIAEPIEEKLLTAKGKTINVIMAGMKIDYKGTESIFNVFTDITKLKEAEQSIADMQRQISNVANSIPGALIRYAINKDGKDQLLYINDHGEALWEVPNTEALKDSSVHWKLVPESEAMALNESLQDSIVNLKPFNHTWKIVTPSGKEKWLNGRGEPIKIADGNYMFDALIFDVTEAKNNEIAKDTLFRELHHRIKNNLNMVTNLLNLKSKITENQELTEFIKETQNRIQSIAKTHDQLLKLEEFDELFTKQYIDELVDGLINSYTTNPEMFTLDLKVENFKMKVDDILILGLLINEIISNAFKYAYDDLMKGKIVLHFERKQDQVHLLIGDEGKGMKSKNSKKSTSLGINLIHLFVKQLKGTMETVGTKGVMYSIYFPININHE